jgi:hypothetical protein
MTKAFVMLTASRVEPGEVKAIAGAVQQETRLYEGDQCVCVLLVTFPPGSPQYEQFHRANTLDGAPRLDSIGSDVQLVGADS